VQHDVKNGKPRKPFRLQEHVEWIAMAFVLALTFRCFVVEAYQIPTGSMAPTLYGRHFEVSCPYCGERFVTRGPETADYPVFFFCPACGREGAPRSTRTRLHGGDRILVAKDLYLFSRPRRWDVFVFKSPKRNERTMTHDNFVKRLVGLPGETLEIRNGQVFVDGHIARKPGHVQGRLWQPVYNYRNENPQYPCWRSGGGWDIRKGKLALVDAAESWQTIEYARPIRDFYAYNARSGDNVVGDLLVAGHVNIDEDQGSFSVAVYNDYQSARHTVTAIFTPIDGRLGIELRKDERLLSQTASLIASPRDFDFSLAVVDGSQEVCVDGVSALYSAEDLSPDDVPLFTSSSGVFFGGYGTKLLVSGAEIKRDVYYSTDLGRPDRSVTQPFVEVIPQGQYLALGDNSPISNDSRKWGLVPEANVLGKAFFVFWPPPRVRPVF